LLVEIRLFEGGNASSELPFLIATLRSKKPLWAKRPTSPLQERPERQEKRSGYSIAAERWGRAKWLIALLVVIAVVLIVMALGRGM
jgi:hypothetical protein